MSETRTAVPLRIFLSYGHDGNEELVRRIKADLEQRGHDVWFYRSETFQLATRLPNWLDFVTSRPESAVQTPLQGLNPFVLDTRTEANRADIRDYLRRELASPLQNRSDADRLIGQILEKSEGVFLYAERFCDDVQRGHLTLDRPEQFPQGLGGIFYQWFQRQFSDLEKFRKDVRPALYAILDWKRTVALHY